MRDRIAIYFSDRLHVYIIIYTIKSGLYNIAGELKPRLVCIVTITSPRDLEHVRPPLQLTTQFAILLHAYFILFC